MAHCRVATVPDSYMQASLARKPAEHAASLLDGVALVGWAGRHPLGWVNAIRGWSTGLAMGGEYISDPTCFRHEAVLLANVRLDGAVGCHGDAPNWSLV